LHDSPYPFTSDTQEPISCINTSKCAHLSPDRLSVLLGVYYCLKELM
jgi:hypothetical protein